MEQWMDLKEAGSNQFKMAATAKKPSANTHKKTTNNSVIFTNFELKLGVVVAESHP